MAIQFNPNALNAFSHVDFGDDDAIANLGDGNRLVQKDKLGSFLWKPFRSGSTEKRNNAVRTELLKALGRAFDLAGVSEKDGRTTFSADFMDRLEEILGPAFRRDDFGLKNGEVKSGKPLTQRRITAIVNAARAKGDEVVDGPKREEPIYISDRSKDEKRTFMSFYDAKLDGFAENGGPSKKEFDNVLSTLFNRVRGTSRTALVELLANGKIAIPVVDGRLPEGKELQRLDGDVKAILRSLRSLNGKETVYDIVLNTVKTAEGTLAPEDVDISGDDLDDLREAACGVDLSGLLSAKGDAEALGRALGEFRQKVYAEFDAKFPDAKADFSATKLAIMKNVFVHYAIIQTGIKYASFEGVVSELRERYDDLVKDRDTRELLDLIVPSIETASNETIA